MSKHDPVRYQKYYAAHRTDILIKQKAHRAKEKAEGRSVRKPHDPIASHQYYLANKARILAYQKSRAETRKNYLFVYRVKRRQQGLCRDCPNPSTRQLCDVCVQKASARQPHKIAEFNHMKKELRYDALPAREDRKRNGKMSGALLWALENHCV